MTEEFGVPGGVVLLALVAWVIATAARRLVPVGLAGVSSSAELAARRFLIAFVIVVQSVAILGFAGWLHPGAILGAAVLLGLGASMRFQRLPFQCLPLSATSDETTWSWPLVVRGPAILTGLLVAIDLIAYLPASPVDWDAVTYHLYLPARWLQEGQIFHIPTVFGDNAAAFAPQNGALFFAWLMALSGRDAVINVSQGLCLAFCGLVLYRLCRRLGAGRSPSALAALTLPWLAPIRRWTYSANVDVFMVAFALGALLWALEYRRQPSSSTGVAAGLAAGLAAGTKTLGLPLAIFWTLPLVGTAVVRRRFQDLALFLGSALIAGGWWYALNLGRYGNPLFPVQVSLGPLVLPGAYDASALRAGEFHLDGPAQVLTAALHQFGVTTCLLMALGLLALGLLALGRGTDLKPNKDRSLALLLLSQALVWLGFFVAVIPHNDQTRFLMPTLMISLVGWGLILDRAHRMALRASPLAWLIGILLAVLASQPWQGWGRSLAILDQAGVDVGSWILTCSLCVVGVAGSFWLRRRWQAQGRKGWALQGMAVASFAVAGFAGVLGTLHADVARSASFAAADYRGWAEGYLPFQDPSQRPSRVAYTGANVPYALMGEGLRHRVAYINTQGEAEDAFYQHWQRDPRQYDYHKPGLYRGQDDVDRWLHHLEAQQIDTLVIFRLHRAENRYLQSTAQGFPIEQIWARQRPERFEPVFSGPAAEIYLIRSVTEPDS